MDQLTAQLLLDEIRDLKTALANHMEIEGNDIREIKEAFHAAKHVVWFIKMSAGVVGVIAVAWAFLHQHFTFGFK